MSDHGLTSNSISSIIIIIINPLTARVVGAPQMILQPVFSIFPCSPLPSGTCPRGQSQRADFIYTHGVPMSDHRLTLNGISVQMRTCKWSWTDLKGYFSTHGVPVSDDRLFILPFPIPAIQLNTPTAAEKHLTIDFHWWLACELVSCKHSKIQLIGKISQSTTYSSQCIKQFRDQCINQSKHSPNPPQLPMQIQSNQSKQGWQKG